MLTQNPFDDSWLGKTSRWENSTWEFRSRLSSNDRGVERLGEAQGEEVAWKYTPNSSLMGELRVGLRSGGGNEEDSVK
jgi:hypothetical protein